LALDPQVNVVDTSLGDNGIGKDLSELLLGVSVGEVAHVQKSHIVEEVSNEHLLESHVLGVLNHFSRGLLSLGEWVPDPSRSSNDERVVLVGIDHVVLFLDGLRGNVDCNWGAISVLVSSEKTVGLNVLHAQGI
jgi:hypothetical protein